MLNVYDVNGLQFWSEREIRLRNQFAEHFAFTFNRILLDTNPAWKMIQVDAPILTPRDLLNKNYTADDVWEQDKASGLALRPETTPGSYAYASYLLDTHSGVVPPFCVWQVGKSFRREQDTVTKNMRLKEFYQMEFQCIYSADSMNNYHGAVQVPVMTMIEEMVGKTCILVESDRLPDYSDITIDVECQFGEAPPTDDFTLMGHGGVMREWHLLELCSISKRTDFTTKARFEVKKQGVTTIIAKDLLVLEVAIGLDRCVHSFEA